MPCASWLHVVADNSHAAGTQSSNLHAESSSMQAAAYQVVHLSITHHQFN
jgi:hypothetical protein